MEALFGQPMAQILERVPVGEDICQALLAREGLYGQLLMLAEKSEHKNAPEEELCTLLHALNMTLEEWNLMQWQAFEWSEEVVALAY